MVHQCNQGHGQVTAADCKSCKDFVPRAREGGHHFEVRFDEHNLAPGQPGKRFNPSILEYGEGYLLAYRDGWAGSNIHVARLDRNFNIQGHPTKLELHHPKASWGREDPRLFWYGGKVHVSFIGVVGPENVLHTNVLFARLGHEFKVEDVFYPVVAGRNLWEKNHSYFAHGTDLFAVYSIAPHLVLQVWGNRTEWAHRVPVKMPWKPGTELRGGAAPVRVGDEYWSFVHSRWEGRPRVYCTTLYTFEAQPPFRPLRIIPEPIDVADVATKPKDQYAAVVFCGGAVRRGEDWILACGIHDRHTELRSFKHAELERRLVPARES